MQIPDQFNFIRWLKDESVALVNDDQGKKIVIKECGKGKILEQFSDTAKEFTRVLRGVMPELYSAGNFLCHTYVEGQIAGDTTENFGLTRFAMQKINPQILAEAIFELQNISRADFVAQAPLERRKSSWYLKNLEETKEAITKEYDLFFYESIDQFIRKNGRIIDDNSNVLVNGDLHPQNLFINCLLGGAAKEFAISDWDLLHINNPGYDLADLKVWSWQESAWFESVLEKALELWKQNNIDINVFVNFNSVYLSCQMIKHVHLMREKNIGEEALVNANGLLGKSREILNKLIV